MIKTKILKRFENESRVNYAHTSISLNKTRFTQTKEIRRFSKTQPAHAPRAAPVKHPPDAYLNNNNVDDDDDGDNNEHSTRTNHTHTLDSPTVIT